jgi:hypothetical protein
MQHHTDVYQNVPNRDGTGVAAGAIPSPKRQSCKMIRHSDFDNVEGCAHMQSTMSAGTNTKV